MFLREVKRANKNGTQVSYLQLVHNEWDPTARASRTKILHSFGRTDQVDPAAIERLITSLQRLLDPTAVPARRGRGPGRWRGSELTLQRVPPDGRHPRAGRDVAAVGDRSADGQAADRAAARPAGRAGAVRAGREPGPGRLLQARRGRLGEQRRAHRRAARDQRRRLLPGDGLADRDRTPTWSSEVFWQVATLLDLEVDLLFFDTTSTYFERDTADEPIAARQRRRSRRIDQPTAATPAPGTRRDRRHDRRGGTGRRAGGERVGFRTYGKSKDHRDDLPQIVIGMAVTRCGSPGAGVVLAGQHHRLGADPPGQGRHAGLDAVADRVGGRPRVLLGREPPLPAPRRSPLHRRGEAALRVGRGHRRAVPPGPLRDRSRRTCGSRKSGSASTNGSSSATTPRAPNATPPSAPGCSPSSAS